MTPPKGFEPIPAHLIERGYTHQKPARNGWFYWTPQDPKKIMHQVYLSPYAKKITYGKAPA